MNINALSEKLKLVRDKRGMTQLSLSVMSGIDQGVISMLESGKNKNPKIITLQSLAEVLEVTISYLIGECINQNAHCTTESTT